MKYADILHRCFRCGFCKLPGNYIDFNCPAYAAFRFETSRRFQEILFSCTACRNCVEQCALPKIKDELLLAFTAGKEKLLSEAKVPPPARNCLTRHQ